MISPGRTLDLDTIQAFVMVADLGSFTRAADAMNTTQSAVSLKLKRLEERLGCRLLDRTPRSVRLSRRGEAFLTPARDLLGAHERAIAGLSDARPRRLILGISDHVGGPELPFLLERLNAQDPLLIIEVRIGVSSRLLSEFDRGELDAAIVRRYGDRTDGEVLVEERFAWFASPRWEHRPGEPVRLATLAAPCGVRDMAVRALDAAGLPWTEVFVGGGVQAIGAAVTAGLAAAALARRVAPIGAVDIGERFGLPTLPRADIVLYVRPPDPRSRDALRTLSTTFRNAGIRGG